jgi:hypothetical protein
MKGFPPRWGSSPSSDDHHQKRSPDGDFATAELASNGVDLSEKREETQEI